MAWRALVCFPKSLGPGADRYVCVALAMTTCVNSGAWHFGMCDQYSYAKLRHVMGSSIGDRDNRGRYASKMQFSVPAITLNRSATAVAVGARLSTSFGTSSFSE